MSGAGADGGNDLLRRAQAHERRGDVVGAIESYKSFLAQHPDHPRAARARAVCAQTMLLSNRLVAALELVNEAPAQEMDDPDLCYVAAQVNAYSGRMDEALDAARRAVSIEPDKAPFIAILVTALLYKGERDEALSVLDGAWARGIDAPELENALAGVAAKVGRVDEAIDRIKRRLKREIRDPKIRVEMGFHLAELLEKRGDYREAWEALGKANAFAERMSMRAQEGTGRRAIPAIGYVKPYVERVRATISVFDGDRLASLAPGEDGPTERPEMIFVCGMPRSGTTLHEQILSAHPDAESAGESNAVFHAKRDLKFGPRRMAAVLDGTERARWSEVGGGILGELRSLAGGSRVVVDKQPGNDEFIGLLAACAPGASVVITRRDPRDVAISCYFRNFVIGHQWATDLRAILGFQRAKLLLHEHWAKVIPEQAPWLRLMTSDYAELVRDPETRARALVAHCGLSWDDACLSFSERDRLVPTLMPGQAKEGIYSGSVARWERYAEFMDEKTLGMFDFLVERFGFGS
jgi:tetratricopeptide (TPR) repeat protein